MRLLMILMFLICPFQVWAMSSLSSTVGEEVLVGKPAPEFTLGTASGESKSLTQVRDGKRTIMFFWATWCPHCNEELEVLSLKLKDIQQKGIQIVLVDAGESREDVKSFLSRRGLVLDSFMDEDNTVSGLYSVVGLPTTFFIDEKGIVRAIEHELPSDYDSKFKSR